MTDTTKPVMFNDVNDAGLVAALQNGGVGVLPTDTLYGLGCRAADQDPVTRLYSLKKREQKPGTLIAASIDQLVDLGLKRRYLTAVERFWPGPISVIIPCGFYLTYLHQGVQSVAVRLSADQHLNQLLTAVGPLLTSSANVPGQPPANTIAEAQKYFGDMVDFYVGGGDLSARKPSTVIRMIDDAVEVLREGAVKIDEETGKII